MQAALVKRAGRQNPKCGLRRLFLRKGRLRALLQKDALLPVAQIEIENVRLDEPPFEGQEETFDSLLLNPSRQRHVLLPDANEVVSLRIRLRVEPARND